MTSQEGARWANLADPGCGVFICLGRLCACLTEQLSAPVRLTDGLRRCKRCVSVFQLLSSLSDECNKAEIKIWEFYESASMLDKLSVVI